MPAWIWKPIAVLIAIFFSGQECLATDYLVDSFADGPVATFTTDGKITLREAVIAASTNQPFADAPAGSIAPDTIRFARPKSGGVQLIRLIAQLQVSGSLRIIGGGVSNNGNLVRISGENQHRIFRVRTDASLSLDQIDLINGRANVGAAVLVDDHGSFFPDEVEFHQGLAVNGGAIAFRGGFGNVRNCTFRDNWASNAGGAVHLSREGYFHAINSTFTGNHANRFGGAVHVHKTEDDFTGFYSASSTYYDNSVGLGPLAEGVGGALSSFNSVDDFDGITLVNSIVAENFTFNSNGTKEPSDVEAHVWVGENNLIGFAEPWTGLVDGDRGNLVGTFTQPLDPRLSSLGFHGGRTRNYVPRSNSLAIDGGSLQYVDGSYFMGPFLELDQRARARIRGANVDIGSVER